MGAHLDKVINEIVDEFIRTYKSGEPAFRDCLVKSHKKAYLAFDPDAHGDAEGVPEHEEAAPNEPEWIYRVVFQSEGITKDEYFTSKDKMKAFISDGIEVDEACEIKVEWISCNVEFNLLKY